MKKAKTPIFINELTTSSQLLLFSDKYNIFVRKQPNSNNYTNTNKASKYFSPVLN